ncbi:hypothetical protein [Furfurilactobacillus siliginis]|uniref:Uncharacterized protein n=1 Tax=Furfurilactobacillus siliginis TaxID=348151 RepID=A0A0R2L9U5_9LACO|nr:hypothetical protein [Furfurilactobacillus siliginis]KRN95495.1 hypothetical protein IV55_GL001957 [Furfurilactobacillus siliginis]GEK29509.1 hypothetical protein LSI01_18200 [Furfurilactobacillus siliginis]
MAITILMIIFALILFTLAGYLWFHRQTGFSLFTPQRYPNITGVITFWAIELTVVGVLALLGTVNIVIMVIALAVGSLSGMGLGLTLVTLMNAPRN